MNEQVEVRPSTFEIGCIRRIVVFADQKVSKWGTAILPNTLEVLGNLFPHLSHTRREFLFRGK